MNGDLGFNNRESILKELRTAVDSQIELWEAIQRIRELIGCDCDPLNWIQNASIFADSGKELGERDLGDFLSELMLDEKSLRATAIRKEIC
jgi:hypothetical protein